MRKKKEKWEVDKLGFVSNGKHFFHKQDMMYVGMHSLETVTLHIKQVVLNITFEDNVGAEDLFKWFCFLMKHNQELINKHHSEHHKQIDKLIKSHA